MTAQATLNWQTGLRVQADVKAAALAAGLSPAAAQSGADDGFRAAVIGGSSYAVAFSRGMATANASGTTPASVAAAAAAAQTVVAQAAAVAAAAPKPPVLPSNGFVKDTSVAENVASQFDFDNLRAGKIAMKLTAGSKIVGGLWTGQRSWVPSVMQDIWNAGTKNYVTLAEFNAHAYRWSVANNAGTSGFLFDVVVPTLVVGTLAAIGGGMAYTAATTGAVGTSVGSVSSGAATALPSIPAAVAPVANAAAAVPGVATSGSSFVGTAGDLFGGVAATPGASSGLAALTTAQASTGVATLSANEILSLAGNPQAFAAYQSAGMIPSGITMSSTGSILTSAGTALSAPSSGGLLSALQNVPTSNPVGGSSGVLDTVTTAAGVASSVVGTVATIATTKAQLDAMKQTNGMPPVQTDTGAQTSTTIPTDITKGLLAVLAVAGYLAFS